MKKKSGPAVTGPSNTDTPEHVNKEVCRAQELEMSFEHRDDGVYWREGNICRRLCNPMKMIGLERDQESNHWCFLIEARDDDKKIREILIPRSMITGTSAELIGRFLDSGITVATDRLSKNRSALALFLSSDTEGRIRRISRVGWTDDGFMLGREHIGDVRGETLRLDSRCASEAKFALQGSLNDWKKHVAEPCAGNSRLVFALSVALAGPIAGLLQEESGGFHFCGPTSNGKSTALNLAASVLGNPTEIMRQWRTTPNAAEAVCAAHNNLTLILDEMGQADADQVGEMIYMIGNGRGKHRLNKDAELKRSYEWNTVILSSGEVDVRGYLSSSGKRQMRGGQLVRLIDIPADAGRGFGIFDNCGASASPDSFARSLKDAALRSYGTPIVSFLKSLASKKDHAATEARDLATEFKTNFKMHLDRGEFTRRCHRFAVIYAAGVIGVRLGVLPFSETEIYEACSICLESALGDKEGSLTADEEAILNGVRSILQLKEASFRPCEPKLREPIYEQLGWVHQVGSVKTFYVQSSVFADKFCSGYTVQTVSRLLERLGHLETDPENKRSIPRRFDGTLKRYYAIKDTIFNAN